MDAPKIEYQNINGCVFKLFWGEKYVIVKCKMFARAKTIIEESLGYYIKGTKMRDKLYDNFFQYIRTTPFYSFRDEILYKGDNPYHLLKQEQLALYNGEHDVNCMNVRFESYYPKLIQGKEKYWINRGHFLNFKRWQKGFKHTSEYQSLLSKNKQ
jgi:hypothetical protein